MKQSPSWESAIDICDRFGGRNGLSVNAIDPVMGIEANDLVKAREKRSPW
jgi:hypothetical protein